MSDDLPIATRAESGWADEWGAIGPFRPGIGPRTHLDDRFSSGPDVGERLPDIVASDAHGGVVDVHAARRSGPAVVVFYRSAVW